VNDKKTNVKEHLAQQTSGQVSPASEVDAFLQAVGKAAPAQAGSKPGNKRGRLVFAMDATASRQRTWDRAMALCTDMFTHTRGIGELDVQLVFYRGFDECRSSKWLTSADKLVSMMRKVSCMAGHTQIHRVLKHGLAECREEQVQALVFIGDCVEESVDRLGNLAGQSRLLSLPVFIFQEGYNVEASLSFAQIAKLSGGAHCRFDESSASQLGELLNAVAAYAAGGKEALQQLEGQGSSQAGNLLEQLS
jgi:hypothetical protein